MSRVSGPDLDEALENIEAQIEENRKNAIDKKIEELKSGYEILKRVSPIEAKEYKHRLVIELVKLKKERDRRV